MTGKPDPTTRLKNSRTPVWAARECGGRFKRRLSKLRAATSQSLMWTGAGLFVRAYRLLVVYLARCHLGVSPRFPLHLLRCTWNRSERSACPRAVSLWKGFPRAAHPP